MLLFQLFILFYSPKMCDEPKKDPHVMCVQDVIPGTYQSGSFPYSSGSSFFPSHTTWTGLYRSAFSDGA